MGCGLVTEYKLFYFQHNCEKNQTGAKCRDYFHVLTGSERNPAKQLMPKKYNVQRPINKPMTPTATISRGARITVPRTNGRWTVFGNHAQKKGDYIVMQK